jgi:hypothetical protein
LATKQSVSHSPCLNRCLTLPEPATNKQDFGYSTQGTKSVHPPGTPLYSVVPKFEFTVSCDPEQGINNNSLGPDAHTRFWESKPARPEQPSGRPEMPFARKNTCWSDRSIAILRENRKVS